MAAVTPDFPKAIMLERAYEGGFVNHPKDPGGPTQFGITIPALSDHRGCLCSAADIQALQWPEAMDIYHQVYWPSVRGDECPAGVDLTMLDMAINMGRGRAVEQLQRALRLNLIDRKFGDGTMKALIAADPVALIETIRLGRVAFYKSLPTFPTFGTGWINRVANVAATSSAWARR
jgi:lysozyme family protein